MTLREHLKIFFSFFSHYVRCELSSKERVYAPFLFSCALLVVFNFAFDGRVDPQFFKPVFLAEVFITLLLSTQMAFMRQFDLEAEDNAFECFRVYGLPSYHLFLAKYLVSFIGSVLVVVPLLFLASFFHLSELPELALSVGFFLILFLVLLGLSALGSLMSSVLQRLNGREILFPLFFYPLSSPLFLIGLQAASFSFELRSVESLQLILLAIDSLYLVLGFLLFDEILN